PAIDAARFVDAVDRHLNADQGGLAAHRGGTRQRLRGADLVGFGLAERRPPGRRDQHGDADDAAAPADQPPARDLAGMPELLVVLILLVGHVEPPVPPGLAAWFQAMRAISTESWSQPASGRMITE